MSNYNIPGSVIYVEDNTLTLRDKFAIAALSGVMSDHNTISLYMKAVVSDSLCDTAGGFAKICYSIADAMLAERNKK